MRRLVSFSVLIVGSKKQLFCRNNSLVHCFCRIFVIRKAMGWLLKYFVLENQLFGPLSSFCRNFRVSEGLSLKLNFRVSEGRSSKLQGNGAALICPRNSRQRGGVDESIGRCLYVFQVRRDKIPRLSSSVGGVFVGIRCD